MASPYYALGYLALSASFDIGIAPALRGGASLTIGTGIVPTLRAGS
jgi:hypothetical protein